MAKKFFYVCAGLFLLALTYHLGARSASAQNAIRRAVQAQIRKMLPLIIREEVKAALG